MADGKEREADFKGRLRRAIEDSGHSIRQFQGELRQVLGERGGASYPAIDRYLRGESEPDVTWLRAASAVLGVRPAWLVNGEEPAKAPPARPDVWEAITPDWFPKGDLVLQATYQRVVVRGLLYLDEQGRRDEHPKFFHEIERWVRQPFLDLGVDLKDLPVDQFWRAILWLLLALDAAIPPTSMERLAMTPPREVAEPKTPKRPKGRSPHKGRTP